MIATDSLITKVFRYGVPSVGYETKNIGAFKHVLFSVGQVLFTIPIIC